MERDNCNPGGSRINKRGIVLRDLGSTVRKGCRSTLLYEATGITGSGNEGKEGNKEGREHSIWNEEADVFNIYQSEWQNR